MVTVDELSFLVIVGVAEQGDMHPSTSAALVGAAMVSTLVYPLVAASLRRRA